LDKTGLGALLIVYEGIEYATAPTSCQ